MWTSATYLPTALFSLKPASATSSGGKTLLTPTPFSIKMALLDAALRTRGRPTGEQLWPLIRDLRVQIGLPDNIVVINTFTKIVRPKKNGPSEDRGTGLLTPLGSTIAYREYVQFGGAISIALQSALGAELPEILGALLTQINYFGKRGGFVQYQGHEQLSDATVEANAARWNLLTADQTSFVINGTLQLLDDCGAKTSFEHIDIYSGKRMTLNKERVLRHIVLPYEAIQSSRSYTLYRRIEAAQ